MSAQLVRGLPAAQYHQTPGLSSTFLRLVHAHDSVSVARWHKEHDPVTPEMEFGTLCHALILEDAGCYAVIPQDIRKPQERFLNAKKPSKETVENIERWDQWQGANAGKIAVKHSDWLRAGDVARAVRSHAIAGPLIEKRLDVEVSLFGEINGAACKARPDLITSGFPFGIVDLKISDPTPKQWPRKVAGMLYHVQAALYLALADAAGLVAEEWAWIVAEPEPPHRVEVFSATRETLRHGRELLDRLIDRMQQSADEDAPRVRYVDLPRWATNEREMESEVLS